MKKVNFDTLKDTFKNMEVNERIDFMTVYNDYLNTSSVIVKKLDADAWWCGSVCFLWGLIGCDMELYHINPDRDSNEDQEYDKMIDKFIAYLESWELEKLYK